MIPLWTIFVTGFAMLCVGVVLGVERGKNYVQDVWLKAELEMNREREAELQRYIDREIDKHS